MGDYVPTGAPLFQVYGDDGTDAKSADCLLGWVALDHERTMEQDLAFGFRQLVDIAEVAVAEVWHYGSASTQVPERLRTMLRDLDSAARPEHRSSRCSVGWPSSPSQPTAPRRRC